MNTATNTTPAQAQQIIYDLLRTGYGLPDTISKIIVAQSGHETAGWSSNVYKTLNNAFGYGYVGNGNYNGYNSIEDSVSDVVNWLTGKIQAGTFPALNTITDIGTYAQALSDNGYYTDSESNYAGGMANWFNNNLALGATLSVAAVLGIALLIFLVVRRK